MSIASNIVVEWLHSLHLGEYAESFVDNGYDDLEICKQISEPDLDAIGVFKQSHRLRLLQSVKRLREEGAASVYFTLEESSACLCESSHEELSPGISDKEAAIISQTGAKFLDEYEEGKAELVRIPRMQLRILLQEKLRSDGIRLACQPYTTPNGERGYLEGLASRYADLLRTHYGDVLEPLEELRRYETNVSPRISNTQLTTSYSQPIYVPGKYSPSSCLSDKEEDEIYGFGYGVFGRQMLQQRQQKLALATQNLALTNSNVQKNKSVYQSCLSPRSAFFYEFPPNEQGHMSKKKTTFSRILRGLKTHRKEKHSHIHNSPRYQTCRMGVSQRVDTPDSVLHSGLGLTTDMGHTVLRSVIDPRDYDRVEYLQTNGVPTNSFEETIHRLKVQEAMKKKERFNKEHEQEGIAEIKLLNVADDAINNKGAISLFLGRHASEKNILRDIRQGLMQLGREGQRQYQKADDIYMYDEEARCGDSRTLEVVNGGIQHWYDEPPYESDPEDFLMGCNKSETDASTTIENDRGCYKLNVNSENHNESIISLRTAGDISLPKTRTRKKNSTMRGLIVPQGHNNPPTIIPLTHSKTSRESGEYASSDLQSRSSDEDDNPESLRSQSTDYEDTEVIEIESSKWHDKQHLDISTTMTLENCTNELKGSCSNNEVCSNATTSGIVGRARTLRQDVQRKISRLRQQRSSISDAAFPCSASSVESLPSGSGSSSTQALVRVGSNHSSISCEDRESNSPQRIDLNPPSISSTSSSTFGPNTTLCRAKALVDCMPSPYDKDALAFKKGDIIDVLQMNTSGLWKGMVHNRFGHFKFINVEIINERFTHHGKWGQKYRQKPGSVPELLQRMNLKEYISVFLLNGYEDLELFRELEPADLDYLRIRQPEHRAKILTAVQLLHDLQSGSEGDELVGSSSETDDMSSIDFSMSRLGISKQQSQRSENNLNAESTDNKSTEFQVNVPLNLPTPGTSSCVSTPIDQ